MKLQTIVDIQPSDWKIDYYDKILTIGSCFSDEMAEQLRQRNMHVTSNPFGTLYNPLSIADAIKMTEVPELVQHDGLWHSMAHHGSFSRTSKEDAEQAVRASIENMQKAFKEATVVIVTFGTAWVYEYKGEVVGNCHKLPEKCFTRRRLSIGEIMATWAPIFLRNPLKHWIFTVSPIRYIKDGLHENQLSKATLLQAVEGLVADSDPSAPVCLDSDGYLGKREYFPSYEIFMDELRDYRFYADDLVHPSSLAINYIWERFVDCFCTPQTKNELVLQHKRWKHEHHIPLH